MSRFMIQVELDGSVNPADDTAPLGASDKAVVFEIRDCPDRLSVADVIAAFQGFKPRNGYSVDYAELTAARSSCCGSCGG